VLDWRSLALVGSIRSSVHFSAGLGLRLLAATHHPRVFELAANYITALGIDPVLMCAATGRSVMGKMVDAQSITIATAATEQVGNEGLIFRFVMWHSVALGDRRSRRHDVRYVFGASCPWTEFC